MDYRQTVVSSMSKKYKQDNDDDDNDDDEELEKLRLAALKSLKPKTIGINNNNNNNNNINNNKHTLNFLQSTKTSHDNNITSTSTSNITTASCNNQRVTNRKDNYIYQNIPPRQNGNIYYPCRNNKNLIEIVPVDANTDSTENAAAAKNNLIISNNKHLHTTNDTLEDSKFNRYEDNLSGSDDEEVAAAAAAAKLDTNDISSTSKEHQIKYLKKSKLIDTENKKNQTESDDDESIRHDKKLYNNFKNYKDNDQEQGEQEDEGAAADNDEDDNDDDDDDNDNDDDDDDNEEDGEDEDEIEEKKKDIEDDDDVLVMADHEEEDSLERLMDEMEREMNDEKLSDNKKEKQTIKKESKDKNCKKDNLLSSSSSRVYKNNYEKSYNFINNDDDDDNNKRNRSLSPKQKQKQKHNKKSPRRSPLRQIIKKSQSRQMNIRHRSPKYSPRPRSRSPINRRSSPYSRSPLLPVERRKKSRSPKTFTNRSRRSRSPSSAAAATALKETSRKRRSTTPLLDEPSFYKRENSPLRKKNSTLTSTSTSMNIIKHTHDPIFEARRKKFESKKIIDGNYENKKIKLSKKLNNTKNVSLINDNDDNDNVYENVDNISTSIVNRNESSGGGDDDEEKNHCLEDISDEEKINHDDDDNNCIYENITETELSLHLNYDFGDFEDVVSDDDLNDNDAIKISSPVKIEKEKIKKKKKKDKEIYQVGKLKSDISKEADEILKNNKKIKKNKIEESIIDVAKEIIINPTDEEADLRTELSRRRAERLNRAPPIQSARLLQSAFKGVVKEAAKNNSKINHRQIIKGDDKKDEMRRVTVVHHRSIPDLSDSEDDKIVDSKVPIRLRLGLNKQPQQQQQQQQEQQQETRQSKVSRKSSKRQGQKVKHNNLSGDDDDDDDDDNID